MRRLSLKNSFFLFHYARAHSSHHTSTRETPPEKGRPKNKSKPGNYGLNLAVVVMLNCKVSTTAPVGVTESGWAELRLRYCTPTKLDFCPRGLKLDFSEAQLSKTFPLLDTMQFMWLNWTSFDSPTLKARDFTTLWRGVRATHTKIKLTNRTRRVQGSCSRMHVQHSQLQHRSFMTLVWAEFPLAGFNQHNGVMYNFKTRR